MSLKFNKKLIHWLGRLLMLLSFIYLGRAIYTQVSGFHGIVFSAGAIVALAALVLFYFSQWIVAANIWRYLLHGGNVYISLRKSFMIVGQAQIAKYLPGNIFQYVGRLTLSYKYNIPTPVVANTIGIELIICVLSCLLLAAVEVMFVPEIINSWLPFVDRALITKLLAGMAFIAVCCMTGLIFSRRLREWFASRRSYIKPLRMLLCIGQFLAVFTTLGAFTWFIAHSVFGVSSGLPWYRYASRITLAWLIGFVVPGAPGGLGIREALTVKMFEDDLGEGVALCLALAMRLCNIAGDMLVFLAAWLLAMKFKENPKTQDTTPPAS